MVVVVVWLAGVTPGWVCHPKGNHLAQITDVGFYTLHALHVTQTFSVKALKKSKL